MLFRQFVRALLLQLSVVLLICHRCSIPSILSVLENPDSISLHTIKENKKKKKGIEIAVFPFYNTYRKKHLAFVHVRVASV